MRRRPPTSTRSAVMRRLPTANRFTTVTLIKSGGRPARIRRCAAAPGNGDPRVAVKNAGVPVINVLQQGDVLGSLDAAARRQRRAAAIGSAGARSRGTAHSSPPPYRTAVPVAADLAALGPSAVVRADGRVGDCALHACTAVEGSRALRGERDGDRAADPDVRLPRRVREPRSVGAERDAGAEGASHRDQRGWREGRVRDR